MFMETPITEAAQKAFGPTGTPTAPVEEPSSDNRGWTVFGAPSPVGPAGSPQAAQGGVPTSSPQGATVPSPAAPVGGGGPKTVIAAHQPARSPIDDLPVDDEPPIAGEPPRGKTIIAAGMTSSSGTPGEVTGRTGSVPAMPDTQYFRRGDIAPERPTVRTTELDVPAGARTQPDDQLALAGHDSGLERRSSGGRTALLVVGGLALVGGVVAAVLFLT